MKKLYAGEHGLAPPSTTSSIPIRVQPPTRSRMSFIHQQHQQHQRHDAFVRPQKLPFQKGTAVPAIYSARLLFSLGFVQLICGMALLLLSLMLYRFEKERLAYWTLSFFGLDVPELFRVLWLGVWVCLCGLYTVCVAVRAPPTCFKLYSLFASQFASVLVCGALAILLSNSVIQHSVLGPAPTPVELSPPLSTTTATSATALIVNGADNYALYFNVFMLCFCTVAFVISIVALSLLAHQLCSCGLLSGPHTGAYGRHSLSSPYRVYDSNTWSKKERIVQWVMAQQNQLVAGKAKVITTIQRELTRTTTMTTTTRTMTSQSSLAPIGHLSHVQPQSKSLQLHRHPSSAHLHQQHPHPHHHHQQQQQLQSQHHNHQRASLSTDDLELPTTASYDQSHSSLHSVTNPNLY